MEYIPGPNADCGKLCGKQNDAEANAVNHPSHYTAGEVECIDAIRSMLGDGFIDYCRGNVVKYLWRAPLKGGLEDYRKARQYLTWITESEFFDEVYEQQNKDAVPPISSSIKDAIDYAKEHAPMEFYDVISPCTDEPCDDSHKSPDTADGGRVYGTGEDACVMNKGCMKTGGDSVA